jgi:hypothetical protein
MRSFWFKPLGFALLLVSLEFVACDNGPEPRLNERFPAKEPQQLSPPIVEAPIHECATIVHVYGFIPKAKVEVYANTSEKVGEATPHFGFADILLTRALKLGEAIDAIQIVNGVASAHSIIPVVVTAYPLVAGGFEKPVVGADLFDCGAIAPVGHLVPSVMVHVFEDGTEVGSGPTAGDWLPVWTSPLHAGKQVTAVQVACDDDPSHTLKSPSSDPVTVQPIPLPLPKPGIDGGSLYAGNDAVTLTGLFVGAKITVYDKGTIVASDQYATGGANLCPINAPLSSGSVITATQELCGNVSVPSDPARPTAELPALEVLDPICAGSQFVVIRHSVVNANVVVLRNGSVVGYGGGVPGDLVLGLGGGVHLAAGDHLTAYQYFGSVLSLVSNTATVLGGLEAPFVEITGGEPFFNAEGGEQQIAGPVFPRGRGSVGFRIQTCCAKAVTVDLTGPGGVSVGGLTPTEVFPGYFSASWDWSSSAGWPIPNGIPIGEYEVRVKSDCHSQVVKKKFYVIFDPAQVGGPARFSFNETGIWFGAPPSNSTMAIVYHLHPDDQRVFSMAISAASGLVDQLPAAEKVSDAVESHFVYDLGYHGDDVIHLLTSETEAQCADEANLLAGLLRAIGIPAHPATADAALETKAADWTFDTWTEFLVPQAAGPDWLILHPHQFPTMNPEPRNVFSSRGVASKGFNDLVVMANENWNPAEVSDGVSDVTYNRQDCGEPVAVVTKANWIGELCEAGYWSPNHWDCAGLHTNSLGLSVQDLFDVPSGPFHLGGPIAGNFSLKNDTAATFDDDIRIELVSDLEESMVFPDTVYQAFHRRVRLAARDTVQLPFEFRLPNALPPGHILYLVATTGKQVLSFHRIDLPPEVEIKLQVSDTMRVGRKANLVATITNKSEQDLKYVDITLDLPFALTFAERSRQRLESIRPGASKTVRWSVNVIAPLEAGRVRLIAETASGSSAVLDMPVAIPDQPVQDPHIQPTRQH